MEKYSQTNEQQYILDYFKGNNSGIFVDIGAYDGKTFSNTHALALLGWSGVCVEPSPVVFPKLLELYKSNGKIQLFQKAISSYSGEVEFWDSNGDAVSSLIQAETVKWANGGVKFTKHTVESITVKELLKYSNTTKIDFLSIDCEGLDFEILKQIDLKALHVKMVCIECPYEMRKPVKDYLTAKGYTAIHENAENLISVV